ncbi:MAG: insulinase family protein [Bryobacterales bacterium]|nr:insulinase family protein [Bryobacterales bacterium]
MRTSSSYGGARLVAGALALLMAAGGAARGQSIAVKSHTLENGMKVIVHEDHDLPNVALYFFFQIGSRNERPGTTGLSHFFEHMMFNGAKKYGPKQFDIQMEKAGGANNAYTTQDVTVYTDWFAKGAIELMFDMEADRIRDLAIEQKIVDSERGVVYSERRLRVDNSNFGALNEQVNAAAFTAHPYGWPVIGWPSDIEGWTLEDLKAHFRMGYAPNNCVTVITGAVTEAEAMALVKKYLAPIPRQEPPPVVRTVEPEQKGERRVTVEKAAQAPLWMASYHTVRSRDAEYWPLEALGRVLSSGRSSRLHQRLVEKEQLALSVRAGTGESLDPGTFDVTMQLRPGADVAKAEAVLDEELARVATAGVEERELEKARNQMRTELFRELSTIAGKANLLGRWEVFFGGHEKLAGADGILQGITAGQVKAVAAKYVKKANRTVGVLVPVAAQAKTAAAKKEGGR